MIPFKSFNSKQIIESETNYNEFVSVLAEEYEMSVEEVETLIEDVVKEKNRYRIAGSKNRPHRVDRNYIKKRFKRAGFVKAKKYILDKKGRKIRLDTKTEARYRAATHRKMENMDVGGDYHGLEQVTSRTLKKMSRMSKSPKKKDNSAMRAFIARSAAIKYKKAKASRPVVKKLKKKTSSQPRRLASASR